MKLVKETLGHLKSNDVYDNNKKHFNKMIIDAMKHYKLSKDVAVMMLTKGIERAAEEMK